MTDEPLDDPYECREHENFVQTRHGWCYFHCEPNIQARVYGLQVPPEHRRQGRARTLLGFVVQMIRASGHLGDIEVEVAPVDHCAPAEVLARFYTEVGLKVTEIREN